MFKDFLLSLLRAWLGKLESPAQPLPVAPKPPLPVVPMNIPTAPTIQPPKPPETGVLSAPGHDLLTRFCLAIQSREGYYGPGKLAGYPKGTPAYVNCNPGNLRCDASNRANWNHAAIGQNNNFCVFPTYDVGFQALVHVVSHAAAGNSSVYRADMLLYNPQYDPIQYRKSPSLQSYWPGFFQLYSPSDDNNDPESYAREVSDKLGVNLATFKLKDLLS